MVSRGQSIEISRTGKEGLLVCLCGWVACSSTMQSKMDLLPDGLSGAHQAVCSRRSC